MDGWSRGRIGLRFWCALAGVVVSVGDAAILSWLGTTFTLNGRDVFWLVAAWFSGTGALLGFLLGDAIDTRRRERATAAALASARARVAQTDKLAALGQLAAAIAHEVRNPLAVVRSAAQGLTETLPHGDTNGQRAASFIIAEVDRLSSVVSSLLAFARPLQLNLRPVALADVVTRATDLAVGELATRGVRLQREQPPSLPTITADGDLVCQVLLGLLSNAGQAVAAGGSVTVEARAAADAVELAVSDDGPGIPAEIRGRIFEPFFTTRPRGTGLGLAVVRQIVEAHGGTIDVGDRTGGGARFTVKLPVGTAA
jgi:two-component system sensor histidine kinase HydH